MADKKFANIHYPGMRIDPNEGKQPISEAARQKFSHQIECIGEEAQRILLASSVLVIGASSLGIRLARTLMEVGIGRVGMLNPTRESEPSVPIAETSSPMKSLSKWAKDEAPWAQFEPFSNVSWERETDEVFRGFGVVVDCQGAGSTQQTLKVARELGLSVLAGDITGPQAWIAVLPQAKTCVECAQLPKAESQGIYLPLMETVAVRLMNAMLELLQNPDKTTAYLEQISAVQSPWQSSRREIVRRNGCTECKK